MNKAVFLDRDGTLNSDLGHYYIFRKEDFILNEGVIEGLKILQSNGFKLIVVTNQGGVDKGEYSNVDVEAVHDYMKELLAKGGVYITAVYYCPHHESVTMCECRKPSSYMLQKAIDEWDLDVSKCYMIGDSDRDVESAKRLNIKSFKIKKNSSIISCCEKIVANEN